MYLDTSVEEKRQQKEEIVNLAKGILIYFSTSPKFSFKIK